MSELAEALQAIRTRGQALNLFTAVRDDPPGGAGPGLLAGRPIVIANAFDVAGVVTLAGGRLNRRGRPANGDASAVARLSAAGGAIVGVSGTEEFGLGASGENVHYGPTCHPRDRTRMTGGPSGGVAAAVADGMASLGLAVDLAGGARVPAALCGAYGWSPSSGRVPLEGMVRLSPTFDNAGLIARSPDLLERGFAALTGNPPIEPEAPRIAIADDPLLREAAPGARGAVEIAAGVLRATERVTLPDLRHACAAARIILLVEGAQTLRAELRERPRDLGAHARDRLLAGALAPADWIERAHRFRRWWHAYFADLFRKVDVLLAPTTPTPAPSFAEDRIALGAWELAARDGLGLFAQAFALAGLPAVTIPIARASALPLGVQAIAAPGRDELLLALARRFAT
jgi:aspartyl-tRNA(Asn)/glutamyl-tRNA(Gln) amidotransferase subunit A